MRQQAFICSDHYYNTVKRSNSLTAATYETVEANLEGETEGDYDQIVGTNKKFEGDDRPIGIRLIETIIKL